VPFSVCAIEPNTLGDFQQMLVAQTWMVQNLKKWVIMGALKK
jgi:hypothetical protein